MLPHMSGENFKVVFNGPAVDDGDIDVRDLAPALLALGDIFQSASDVLNGDRVKTSVKVRATAQACFEVDLTVAQSTFEYVKTLVDFASDSREVITDAKSLTELILNGGKILGFGVLGLIGLLKWLDGRKPDKIERTDVGTRIHIGDVNYVIDPRTLALAESHEVRTHVKKFASAVSPGRINEIAAVHSGEKVSIKPEDVPSFDLPAPQDEELSNEVRKMNLQIISLSFKDDNKWRVTDGADPFSAAIEDEDFQKKVDNSEISFSKGDYLVCEVREKQLIIGGSLKKERTIIRVLEHKPAAKQMKLL